MKPVIKAIALVVLLLGIALAAYGWFGVAKNGEWITAPARIDFVAPDGKVFHKKPPWSLGMGFDYIIDETDVWTVFKSGDDLPSGSLVKISPEQKRALASWPFPADMPFEWVEGVLPDGKGRLAIVYRTSSPKDALVAAIAGPGGWQVLPFILVQGGYPVLLGMSWNGEKAEFAFRRPAEDDEYGFRTDPGIGTVNQSGDYRTRTVRREVLCAPFGAAFCGGAQGAYQRSGETVWRFFMSGSPAEVEKGSIFDVAETGKGFPVAVKDVHSFESRVDRSSSGILARNGTSLEWKLLPDGDIVSVQPAPESASGAERWNGHYRSEGSHLSQLPLWYDSSSPNGAFIRIIKDRVIRTAYNKTKDDELLIVDRPDSRGKGDNVVARTYSFFCGDLFQGALVPIEKGGFWLLNRDGCMVTLDASLRRADPLNIVDHFKARGSINPDWNEMSNVLFMAWVLLGMPVVVLLALVIASVLQRRKGGSLFGNICLLFAVFGGVYVISAGIMLMRLLPLMR